MNSLLEKIEKVKDLRPIDDVFFEKLAQNKAVCQEILRVLLEDRKLIVHSVITQSSKNNLYGRSVRLDALCTLGNGTKCNIEVQRANDDGTDISDLMACFMKKEVKNPKFPSLSAEVSRLKETEGGAQAVCEVMEKYEKIAVHNEKIERIQAMIKEGLSKEIILRVGYTEDEYSEAENQMKEHN